MSPVRGALPCDHCPLINTFRDCGFMVSVAALDMSRSPLDRTGHSYVDLIRFGGAFSHAIFAVATQCRQNVPCLPSGQSHDHTNPSIDEQHILSFVSSSPSCRHFVLKRVMSIIKNRQIELLEAIAIGDDFSPYNLSICEGEAERP